MADYDLEFQGVEYQWGNWNAKAVQNGPPDEYPTFTINEPVTVTYIDSYHWNDGKGVDEPGSLSLGSDDSTQYGPWTMNGRDGQGGAPNVIWYKEFSEGDVVLQPGTYSVIDFDPQTWSSNAASGHTGFFGIQWKPYKLLVTPAKPIESPNTQSITAEGLGSEWTSVEKDWKGSWSRIPGTNTFNAVFTKGGDYVEDTFDITSVEGNTVTLHRNRLNQDWVGTYSEGKITFGQDWSITIVK
jgi:hypothetical protein